MTALVGQFQGRLIFHSAQCYKKSKYVSMPAYCYEKCISVTYRAVFTRIFTFVFTSARAYNISCWFKLQFDTPTNIIISAISVMLAYLAKGTCSIGEAPPSISLRPTLSTVLISIALLGVPQTWYFKHLVINTRTAQ